MSGRHVRDILHHYQRCNELKMRQGPQEGLFRLGLLSLGNPKEVGTIDQLCDIKSENSAIFWAKKSSELISKIFVSHKMKVM